MAEVPFRPARQLSEYKGKGASASRESLNQKQRVSYKNQTLIDSKQEEFELEPAQRGDLVNVDVNN